jgi:hypothetical protein
MYLLYLRITEAYEWIRKWGCKLFSGLENWGWGGGQKLLVDWKRRWESWDKVSKLTNKKGHSNIPFNLYLLIY